MSVAACNCLIGCSLSSGEGLMRGREQESKRESREKRGGDKGSALVKGDRIGNAC